MTFRPSLSYLPPLSYRLALCIIGFSYASYAAADEPQAAQDNTSPIEAVTLCPSDKILLSNKAYPAETLPNEKRSYKAWHKKNTRRKDVVTTRSGLQYKVIQPAIEGGISPTKKQDVTVHYHGYFPNGEIFDSSYGRGEPIELPTGKVIKGWIEALQDMKTCEARTLYIPGKLAYGRKGKRGIPPNVTLVFNIQLIAVGKT